MIARRASMLSTLLRIADPETGALLMPTWRDNLRKCAAARDPEPRPPARRAWAACRWAHADGHMPMGTCHGATRKEGMCMCMRMGRHARRACACACAWGDTPGGRAHATRGRPHPTPSLAAPWRDEPHPSRLLGVTVLPGGQPFQI